MWTDTTVNRFLRFYNTVLNYPTNITIKGLNRSFAKEGKLVKKLLSGKISKAQYLSEQRAIDASIEWNKRSFFVFSSQDLEDCMFAICEDRNTAKEQRNHEEGHAKDMRRFLRGKHAGEVCYSLFVTSDGSVTPFTGVYITLLPLVPLKLLLLGKTALYWSIRINPYALTQRWSLQESVDFWRFLQGNVERETRSLGDQLILG